MPATQIILQYSFDQHNAPVAAVEEQLTKDLVNLALEIFITTYGCDWQQAIEMAFAMRVELTEYANRWDEDVDWARGEHGQSESGDAL